MDTGWVLLPLSVHKVDVVGIGTREEVVLGGEHALAGDWGEWHL